MLKSKEKRAGKSKKKSATCKICKELAARVNAMDSRLADLETEVAALKARTISLDDGQAAIISLGVGAIDPPGPEWGA